MDCLISADIGDELEPILQKIYTAHHSKHVCCECSKQIKRGTKYERYVGKNEDGDKEIYYTCIDCLSVRNAFFSNYVFCGTWDLLEQEFEDGTFTDECLAKNLLKCTEAAREKIAKLIERYMPNENE